MNMEDSEGKLIVRKDCVKHMQQKKKTKKSIKPVTKPFLRGKAVDGSSFKSMIMFFLAMLVMAVANLFLSTLLLWDNQWISIVFNVMLLLVIYALFFQGGATKGTIAVNQGEILYQRKEAGKPVNPKDLAACYHPLKGFIIGLVGSLPMLVCAVMLAAVAQRQMSGLGALPGWIGTLQRRPEVGAALSYYNVVEPMTLEDALRVIVRMLIMPFVNMVGTADREGLLTLEKLSILPMLLPALSYGIGYQQGVSVRTQVHTDIAKGKRKRAKKERKQRQARMNKEPEQLN